MKTTQTVPIGHALRRMLAIAATRRPGMRLAVLCLLAACSVAFAAGAPEAGATSQSLPQSRLKAHFLLDGRPHPATLTVAATGFRRTFVNVTAVDASVPSDATYRIEAAVPVGAASAGPITFIDVIPSLRIPPGQTFEANVHLIADASVRAFDPVLLIEEVGANAVVRNTVQRDPQRPERFTLRTEVRSTPGTRVILDTILEQLDSTQGYVCLAPCRHVFPPSGDWYTCSTTAKVYHGYWIPNYNWCESAAGPDGSSNVESTFEAIVAGSGGVLLNAAMHDGAIVRPLTTEMTSIRSGETMRLAPPFSPRSFPDFVVPAGFYTYALTFPAMDGSSRAQRFTLPVEVRDRAILPIFLALPAPEEVHDLRAIAIGDTLLGTGVGALRSTLRDRTLHVEVEVVKDSRGDDVGWIAVPFPSDLTVADVRHVSTSTPGGERLTQMRDYTVGPLGDGMVLVLRAATGRTAYTIQFSP